MPKYQLLVVLGYRQTPEFVLPPHAFLVLEGALRLFQKNTAPLIAVCGKWSLAWDQEGIVPKHTESGHMKRFLVANGVPQAKIIRENESKDTIGNAYFLKRDIVLPRKITNFLVVCADFHAPRAAVLFEKIFGAGYTIAFHPVKTPRSDDPAELIRQEEILRAQLKKLAPMKPGDHTYLRGKLYRDPLYKH